jgi:hypothetical protein
MHPNNIIFEMSVESKPVTLFEKASDIFFGYIEPLTFEIGFGGAMLLFTQPLAQTLYPLLPNAAVVNDGTVAFGRLWGSLLVALGTAQFAVWRTGNIPARKGMLIGLLVGDFIHLAAFASSRNGIDFLSSSGIANVGASIACAGFRLAYFYKMQ